jgi:hypothetical protein
MFYMYLRAVVYKMFYMYLRAVVYKMFYMYVYVQKKLKN